MAIFEPLREGFRELNRLVTDRQTFNAQHEARQQDDERKNAVLASQLEDRAFQRASTEKQLLMGAEMNEFQKEMTREKFDQAKRENVREAPRGGHGGWRPRRKRIKRR